MIKTSLTSITKFDTNLDSFAIVRFSEYLKLTFLAKLDYKMSKKCI